jgi:hypothetical protein
MGNQDASGGGSDTGRSDERPQGPGGEPPDYRVFELARATATIERLRGDVLFWKHNHDVLLIEHHAVSTRDEQAIEGLNKSIGSLDAELIAQAKLLARLKAEVETQTENATKLTAALEKRSGWNKFKNVLLVLLSGACLAVIALVMTDILNVST